MTESQKLIYFDLENTLKEMGFRLELGDKLNLKIIGIPSVCLDNQANKILEDLFDQFENDLQKNLLVMEISSLNQFQNQPL